VQLVYEEDLGVRVGAGPFEHASHHRVLERGVEQVFTGQVQVAPLDGLLGRALQQLRRGGGEELGDVHLLRLPPGGRSTDPGAPLVEEPVKEIVEEAPTAQG
jgi:hypothetical protein